MMRGGPWTAKERPSAGVPIGVGAGLGIAISVMIFITGEAR